MPVCASLGGNSKSRLLCDTRARRRLCGWGRRLVLEICFPSSHAFGRSLTRFFVSFQFFTRFFIYKLLTKNVFFVEFVEILSYKTLGTIVDGGDQRKNEKFRFALIFDGGRSKNVG